jgi:hypothetical protein
MPKTRNKRKYWNVAEKQAAYRRRKKGRKDPLYASVGDMTPKERLAVKPVLFQNDDAIPKEVLNQLNSPKLEKIRGMPFLAFHYQNQEVLSYIGKQVIRTLGEIAEGKRVEWLMQSTGADENPWIIQYPKRVRQGTKHCDVFVKKEPRHWSCSLRISEDDSSLVVSNRCYVNQEEELDPEICVTSRSRLNVFRSHNVHYSEVPRGSIRKVFAAEFKLIE